MPDETDIVLSAICRGEDSLPKLRLATGLDYAQLHRVLHELEFQQRSIYRSETQDGFDRYAPTPKTGSKPAPETVHTIPPAALSRTHAERTARELALLQRNAPYCIGCRGLCILHGTDRNDRIRWRCKPCGVTFAGSGSISEMNRLAPEKREAAISAFNEAKSVRQVAREVGICTQTALKIRQEEEIEATCQCGQDAKHKGWCAYRFQQSPARQAVMGKMRERDTLGADEAAALEAMREDDDLPDEDEPRERVEVDLAEDDGTDEQALRSLDIAEPLCGCGYSAKHRGFCADGQLKSRRQDAPKATNIPVRKAKNGNGLEPKPKKSPENITEIITRSYGPFCETNCDPTKIGHHKDCAYWKEAEAHRSVVARNVTSNEESKHAMAKPQDIIPEKFRPTAQVQVMGGMNLWGHVEILLSEIRDWPAERVSEFFDALAKIAEIPGRPLPTTIKPAWSPDLEGEVGNPESTVGLTYCYLIGMLHHNMEPHEKEAVWTLVQYLKRMEAYVEEKRECQSQ